MDAAKFWSKVDRSGTCWLWVGGIARDGYGRCYVGGKRYRVARVVAYELVVGPVPDGLQLDHLCRNRACVNPVHLEPVTAKVNQHRAMKANGTGLYATHCPHGHAYSEDNVYRHPDGRRSCLICNRVRCAGYYARHTAQAVRS